MATTGSRSQGRVLEARKAGEGVPEPDLGGDDNLLTEDPTSSEDSKVGASWNPGGPPILEHRRPLRECSDFKDIWAPVHLWKDGALDNFSTLSQIVPSSWGTHFEPS